MLSNACQWFSYSFPPRQVTALYCWKSFSAARQCSCCEALTRRSNVTCYAFCSHSPPPADGFAIEWQVTPIREGIFPLSDRKLLRALSHPTPSVDALAIQSKAVQSHWWPRAGELVVQSDVARLRGLVHLLYERKSLALQSKFTCYAFAMQSLCSRDARRSYCGTVTDTLCMRWQVRPCREFMQSEVTRDCESMHSLCRWK